MWTGFGAVSGSQQESIHGALRWKGVASMKQSGEDRSFPVLYEYFFNRETHQGFLHIFPEDTEEPIGEIKWFPEVGGEFVDYIERGFDLETKDLILVHCTYGAPTCGLRVYGLSEQGKLTLLFSSASRIGHDYLDVDEDGGKEIVEYHGGIGRPTIAHVYKRKKDRFVKAWERPVTAPYKYLIRE
jgi:hypothetical protein